MVRVLIPLILVGILVFAIVDIIVIDNARVRGLPKFAWIPVVIVLPFIGPLLWFFLGRERLEEYSNGRYANDPAPTPEPGRRFGPIAPDDDPDFLGRLNREQEQEERIRELEKRLKELGDDKPKD
ncbi:PLD nuclease N-terminal domain-containing protein [Lysinimonas soli]|uniref:PLD nuclease N-terminal domain-containing protein n=1 Tax=Lysinimonas soli TaxID=1074233 RepID=A0ABW0NSP8_9MICO